LGFPLSLVRSPPNIHRLTVVESNKKWGGKSKKVQGRKQPNKNNSPNCVHIECNQERQRHDTTATKPKKKTKQKTTESREEREVKQKKTTVADDEESQKQKRREERQEQRRKKSKI